MTLPRQCDTLPTMTTEQSEPMGFELDAHAAQALGVAFNPSAFRVEPPTIDDSEATPAMVLALHKAQQQAIAVPKQGWNNHARYHYATAEDVIAASRDALHGTGLSFLLMWGKPQPAREELASVPLGNQSVGSYLPIEVVLLHAVEGDERIGRIRIRTGVDVMMDARRPPDKAVQAARTYAHGFVLCSLLNIDRGDREDDVDQRPDAPQGEPQAREAPRKVEAPPLAPRDICRGVFKAYVTKVRERNGEPFEFVDFVWRTHTEAEAKAFKPETATDAQWDAIISDIRRAIKDLDAPIVRDTEESGDDHAEQDGGTDGGAPY